jgi:hypothetical protein
MSSNKTVKRPKEIKALAKLDRSGREAIYARIVPANVVVGEGVVPEDVVEFVDVGGAVAFVCVCVVFDGGVVAVAVVGDDVAVVVVFVKGIVPKDG